ncbi:CDP-diacylglycerol--glycerol-3-phosphate 3-phosphatidyltransferase [soil metagenome]
MATSFGSSALLTPANAVTVVRLLLAPIVVVMVVDTGPSWPAFILGFGLAVTDGLDGHMARRHGTTRSGAFLDPLADKVLVLGILYALVTIDRFWWLPVAIIALREVAISVFRAHLGRQGLAVEARYWAKVKTVVQELVLAFALLPLTADVRWIADSLLWLAVALTVITGVQYLHDGRRAATAMEPM